VLPFTDSNNLKTKNLHNWMYGRRIAEQQVKSMTINNPIGGCVHVIDCPALSDVVFKTGTSNLSHPGNSIFHEMLRNQPDDFLISLDIVAIIFENVTRRNGRFLEWDSYGYWKVISDPMAIRQKIYSSFFHAKKSSKARNHRQNNSSSTFLFERQDGRKRKRVANGSEISSCIDHCRY
jgi:hypothetical protein